MTNKEKYKEEVMSTFWVREANEHEEVGSLHYIGDPPTPDQILDFLDKVISEVEQSTREEMVREIYKDLKDRNCDSDTFEVRSYFENYLDSLLEDKG